MIDSRIIDAIKKILEDEGYSYREISQYLREHNFEERE